jgi:hypothetical protein
MEDKWELQRFVILSNLGMTFSELIAKYNSDFMR